MLLYAFVPPIAFLNVTRLEARPEVVGGLLLAALALALVALAAWALATYVLRLGRPVAGALIAASMVPNTGFVGVPIAIALLGPSRAGEAVAFDALVSVPWLLGPVFAVGAAFGSRAGEGRAQRTRAFFTRNPPLFAVVAALLAPDALAPMTLVDASRVLVFALAPICLFAVGTILAGETTAAGRRVPPLSPPVLVALALKLVLAPLLLFLLALLLLDLPHVYMLLVAMPAGLNTIVVAQAYGLDRSLAAGTIFWGLAVTVLGALGLSLV